MSGVSMPEPKHPSCAKPRSSSTMSTTFGAPGAGCGRAKSPGVDCSGVRPVHGRGGALMVDEPYFGLR